MDKDVKLSTLRDSKLAEQQRKPWDARLVERMSRGSNRAPGSGKLTPRQRIAYAVFWIAFLCISVSANGRNVKWWVLPMIVLVGSGTQLGIYLWERKRS